MQQPNKVKTFLSWEEIEPEAQQQIANTASLPFIYKYVAVMPDAHYGKGSTVGTVIATQGAIVPAAVGVDIGCGMIAVKTNLKREQLGDLSRLRASIERSIPMSAGRYNSTITESAQKRIDELDVMARISSQTPFSVEQRYDSFDSNWRKQLGTLGGGNHFIEICLDENEDVWITLHSGSRGVGNQIGMYHINVAKNLMNRMLIKLPDSDLAYLPESIMEFGSYLKDLHWAQKFAMLNREEMMDRVLKDVSYQVFKNMRPFSDFEVSRINCHHNFTQKEYHMGGDAWITRKGAIEASVGKLAMIPGSMGTHSYIVSGLGNPSSFCSAPHGAGRRMSRKKAQASYSMVDLEKAMEGIEYRKSNVLVDEIPMAYKDIDHVMENAKELVKIEHTLKQILNCKGD